MKKLFLFALVATMFAACVTDETQDVAVELAPDTLTVSFEDADSRIQLDNGKTVWTKGDLASVFYRSNANQQWQYQGETGERTGNLKRVNAGNATETMKRVVVVYPYSENYYINTDTYNVEASLPASQSYLKDSYGVGGNIMISQSEFNQFSLKSVCGWLKIQLTGNGEKVKSIKLKGNNGEQVAGLIYINSATAEATLAAEMGGADDNENTAGGNLVFDDTILTEVVLDCGEGVELGAEPTAFYIALPPQTFEKGLTVDVNCRGYNPISISTQKVVAIERNSIQPMAAVKFESEVRTMSNNEIWYTATEKIDRAWTFDNFGANIVSHEWDRTTGEGIITFDGDITFIGESAFFEEVNLTGVTFNNSLKTIGRSAFQGCSSLTEVVIPGNIEKVGYLSFADCLNLTQINIEKGDSQLSTAHSFNNVSADLYIDRDIVGNLLNFIFADAKLTSITIGPNMRNINDSVFGYCTELKSLNIDSNSQLERIERYAFVASHIPGVVRIPASVVEIDSSAFALATGITAFESKSPYYRVGYKNDLISDPATIFRYPSDLYSKNISISSNQYEKIGEYAFSGSNIESVSVIVQFDNKHLKIGDLAFWQCKELKKFESWYTNSSLRISEIGDGVFGYSVIEELNFLSSTFTSINGTFRQCEVLKTLYLPETLIEIGDRSFEDCGNLTSLYIAATTPPTLTSGAFNAVSSDLKIYVPYKSLAAYRAAENWSVYADKFVGYDFENGIVIPSPPNTEIWYTATEKVEPYETNVFGANIVSNEWTAETGKGVLKFDGEITMIGENAFGFCRDLTSIDIPESVTKIENDAFQYCYGLQNIYIPNSVTSIGRSAFLYCDLKEIVIPNNVTSIGAYALCGCSIQCITIPNGVTDIADGLFKQCSQLTNVVLGNQVTSIGDEAFRDCIELQSITIPDSVTRIKPDAFRDCSSLKDVYCKAMTPPTGYSSMFTSCDKNLVIYVPSGCESEYKVATGWSNYADSIVGYDY